MNAPSISTSEFARPENPGDSDSDTSDEIPDFYQPISSYDGEEQEENLDADSNSNSNSHINGYHQTIHHPHGSLSNGHEYDYHQAAASENGMSSLNLNEGDQERETQQEHEEVEEQEEEEERRRAESMRRALEEDESRRNAPLTPENASRVMEAMRGVSFSGLAPDWASQLSEDRLLDRLRRLRPPPHSAA